MKRCMVCGAATRFLYFDRRPLCLDCDHVGEETSPTLMKPPTCPDQSPAARCTSRALEAVEPRDVSHVVGGNDRNAPVGRSHSAGSRSQIVPKATDRQAVPLPR
jgi:hypothetical protein